MNKQEILSKLNELSINKQEYIIISGAAMVIHEIKENTSDIDIATSSKLYRELLENHNCIFERKVGEYDVWFVNEKINFSENYYRLTEYIEYCGYKVQNIESILKLKKQLNRTQDKEDIKKIMDFIDRKKH